MTMILYKNRTPIIPQTKELWILKTQLQSFLKLIDDYDPIFLEIPYDFASLLWGGKVPYGQCLELIDDDLCNCRSLNLLRTQEVNMDQSNKCPSFLKLIEEDDPLFLVKSKFEMDLDKFLIPNNKSHVYLVT
ncbi:hypothetical protein HanRHA438_Chr12g0544631 [Helianthus annuus]|nr:hypothetical protein HanRHA438_Chr12g0544631 [Helianthus annuus]